MTQLDRLADAYRALWALALASETDRADYLRWVDWFAHAVGELDSATAVALYRAVGFRAAPRSGAAARSRMVRRLLDRYSTYLRVKQLTH